MGDRGPVPISSAERKVRGGRAKPAMIADVTPTAAPVAPRTLTGEARAEWNRVVPELLERRLIARTDRAVLVLYCRAWARWCDLDRKLGSAYTSRGSKSMIMNPVLRAWRDTAQLVAQLAKQLALDPASRLRMPAPPDEREPDDPLDLLRQGKAT